MKKIHILGAAVFAVFALTAVMASMASAAEWLVDGAAITALQSTETVGELKLTAEGEPIIGTVEVTCSGILDGTISPGGLDEVTELLSLAGVAISKTPLSGTALSCTNTAKCTTPEVWAVNLPYSSQLASTTDDVTSVAAGIGFEVKCAGIIGAPSDTCTQDSMLSILENMGTPENNVLASTSEVKTASCTTAGVDKGSIESPSAAAIKVLEGLVLATS